MLPAAVLAALSLVVSAPTRCPGCASGQMSRTRMVAMQDNPLARIFGGDKKKKEAGPLTTGLDAITKDAPLPVKLALGMMKPLVGALETAIAEGQEDTDALLTEAQSCLRLE